LTIRLNKVADRDYFFRINLEEQYCGSTGPVNTNTATINAGSTFTTYGYVTTRAADCGQGSCE
jgi:hypothetical protein